MQINGGGNTMLREHNQSACSAPKSRPWKFLTFEKYCLVSMVLSEGQVFSPNKIMICNVCHQKKCESLKGAGSSDVTSIVQQFGVFWIDTVVPMNIRKEHCTFLWLEKQLSNCDSNYGYAYAKFLHFQETILPGLMAFTYLGALLSETRNTYQ